MLANESTRDDVRRQIKDGGHHMSDQTSADPLPGQMTSDQLAKVAEKLNEKVVNGGVCRICQKGPVNIGGDFVTPTAWTSDGNLMIGGPVYPQVMTICGNCGNTQFYNAVALGIVSPNP